MPKFKLNKNKPDTIEETKPRANMSWLVECTKYKFVNIFLLKHEASTATATS